MITNSLRPVALLLLTSALSLTAPGSLWAAALVIDDTNPNETITVSANDFEGGLILNGNTFQSGLNNPATTTFPENGPVTFNGTWITFGQQGPVDRTIYLIESPFNAASPPQISDILHFTITPIPGSENALLEGSFDSSDTLGILPGTVDLSNVFVETGNPVRLDFVGLTLQVTSDVDVPEPTSWVLFGSALLGFISYGLRRRSL
ncbi:MAG TPA: PEP-CTERM sorting domain-containing protein [Pirellulales bacterium]|jgi:hypothetical protein